MLSIHRLILIAAMLLLGWSRYGLAEDVAGVPDRGVKPFQTEIFSFETHGNRLVGLLDTPVHQDPESIIVFVHGYGETNVAEKNWNHDLRSHFARLGVSVVVWDKPGCGQSDGEFDINQPVESSAEEVVAAVRALKAQEVAGSRQIGLWGISRAGWIAPLAIAAEPSIEFWISVSGVDDKENARYLLESNFPIEGRSGEETERLVQAWQQSFDAVWQGKSYQEYMEAAAVLREDSFVQFMGWAEPATKSAFEGYQEQFAKGELSVDEESGLAVYVSNFGEVLSSLDIPVLALFGDRDSNVDWKQTIDLYRQTIGNNPEADLSVHVFPGANHNIRQAETGGIREMFRQARDTPYAEGYFKEMADWIVANNFGSR